MYVPRLLRRDPSCRSAPSWEVPSLCNTPCQSAISVHWEENHALTHLPSFFFWECKKVQKCKKYFFKRQLTFVFRTSASSTSPFRMFFTGLRSGVLAMLALLVFIVPLVRFSGEDFSLAKTELLFSCFFGFSCLSTSVSVNGRQVRERNSRIDPGHKKRRKFAVNRWDIQWEINARGEKKEKKVWTRASCYGA